MALKAHGKRQFLSSFRIIVPCALLLALVFPFIAYADIGSPSRSFYVTKESWCASLLNNVKRDYVGFKNFLLGKPQVEYFKQLSPWSFIFKESETSDKVTYHIEISSKYIVFFESNNVKVSVPYYTKDSDLETIGDLFSRLETFDAFYSNIGFVSPKSTEIFFPIKYTSDLSRRFFGFLQVENRFDSATSFYDDFGNALIFMNPSPHRDFLFEDTVLFHERIHTIINETFPADSFILNNKAFNEAIADFGAAHFTDHSRIGTEAMPFRYLNVIPDLHSIDYQKNNYYDVSVWYSSILWMIRDEIGKDKMHRFLLPVIDILNKELGKMQPTEDYKKTTLSQFSRFVEILIRELKDSYVVVPAELLNHVNLIKEILEDATSN